LLQLNDLRVGQREESCIGLTQENLIENSVQDCLPYILNYHGSWYGYSNGHKSREHGERHRRFWKDDIIQCVQHMLTLRQTHGYLE